MGASSILAAGTDRKITVDDIRNCGILVSVKRVSGTCLTVPVIRAKVINIATGEIEEYERNTYN